MSWSFVALVFIVLLGVFVETVAGFGSTMLTVLLAAYLYPVQRVLPVFIPVNVLLSLYILGRHRDGIDWRLLVRRILPWMIAGLPLGLWAFSVGDHRLFKLAFALFVVASSAWQLAGCLWRGAAAPTAPSAGWGSALLFVGGVVHGMYGTGGPMAVYVAASEIATKRRFRSTLSALWLALNTVLLSAYASAGFVTRATVHESLILVASLLVGIPLGEWLHRRIDDRTFRIMVYTILMGAGAALAARAW
jgi:uncharacterized protein